MDVQTLFYALASVFLVLGIVLMVSLAVLIWKAVQTFQKAQQGIVDLKDTVQAKVSSFAEARSSMMSSALGKGVALFVFNKVKDMFMRSSSKKV